MNNIDINSKPMIGTKNTWGKIFIAWIIVVALSLLIKGCNNDQDTPMFIMKEAISWN